MRIVLASVAVATLSVVAVADAVVRENGPIFFYGSRAPDFYSEIYSVAADGTGRTNLSRNPAADGQPAVSPDGKRVAFVSDREGFDAVYLMNADGSGHEQLVGRLPPFAQGYRIGSLVWSPTGRQLSFGTTQPQPGSFFHASYIYVVDLSSRRLRLLGGVGCGGGRAAFSPDGRFVAYAVVYCRPAVAEVKVVRAADGRAELTVSGTLVGWAPRDNRLLFLRRTRRPRIERVATVDRSGRKLWVLRGVSASAAAWSPSGRLIAFVRRVGPRPGVYVVRPGGQRPRRLVTLANGLSVAWSPNGAWLALSTTPARQGGMTTYLVRASGRGLRRISGEGAPIWSRDSRRLALVGLDGAVRVVSPPRSSAVRVSNPATDLVGGGMDWIGGRLLFTAGGRSTTQLLAVEPDGSGVRLVSPGASPVGAITPDGLRVAFVRDADVWTARLDGSDERQVTSGAGLDGMPAWSPDGQRLAFSRRPSGSPSSDIFVVDAGGGAVRQVTHSDPNVHAGAPTWSPDGNWIAFMSLGGLFAVHPDGSDRRLISSTVGPRAYGEPAWSPDGTRIALGGCAIAVVNADGSGYRELTASGVREGQPSWSPDGTRIVFARSSVPCGSGFRGDSDLWTIKPDGSGETRLTDGPWPDTLPSWQPVRR